MEQWNWINLTKRFQVTFHNFWKLLTWRLEGTWHLTRAEWSWKIRGEAHCQSDGTQTFLSSTRSGILQYERKAQNLTQNKVCHLKAAKTPSVVCLDIASQCYCQYALPTFFALGLVISNSTATQFVCREIHCAEQKQDWQTFNKIKIFIVALTLKMQSFYKTLWHIMMYHQTKCWCQRISSSEDIVETVIFWLYDPYLSPWPTRQKKQSSHMNMWLIILSLVQKKKK